MWSFVERLLGLEWLGDLAKMVNGNKTILGIIALVVHMLNVVPTYLPEYGFSAEVANSIQEALKWLGVLLPVGGAHKVAKMVVGKPQK